MKAIVLFFAGMFLTIALTAQTSWVRINQVGYLPKDVKVAVLISTDNVLPDFSFNRGYGVPPVLASAMIVTPDFSLINAKTGKAVFRGKGKTADAAYWGLRSAYRLDFSSVQAEGTYYIEVAGVRSPQFSIGANVYEGSSDFLLNYLRAQRCGDNPITGICHQNDGVIVHHPTRSGEFIDLVGGWHDANDRLKYTTTTNSAVYHMMLAYHQAKDKSIFKDKFGADGRPGSNGIPDILDEIRWGLEWLVKMNPAPKEFYNQVADNRGDRIPPTQFDNVRGPGPGRPAYFLTGEPQQVRTMMNRTTGVASSAGKFASCFALGAELFKELDPAFSKKMQERAEPAYDYAMERPGNTQTTNITSPYFYEEDNWIDDVELAAATFYLLTKDSVWRARGAYWGELEPINPLWVHGFARHYQFYPFVNLGHHLMAQSNDETTSKKFTDLMRRGLQLVRDRAGNDPFMQGVPYVWCSNFAVIGAASFAHQYREISGDRSFEEMEAALRDWIFGCNPWGYSFVGGFPIGGTVSTSTVRAAHTGGLVDGPMDREWHQTLWGVRQVDIKEDPLAPFQMGPAVYHLHSYGTNEPVIDGTCYLIYHLSIMEQRGKE
ncbi:MAG: glycoside hydrolase family 9 protein [Prevotellaceae bacterium]|jgi:hypothetical protein|nr:glycoside hydrolase family 9 protein [Prevotellaceae bacterium]